MSHSASDGYSKALARASHVRGEDGEDLLVHRGEIL